ncbi:hypothetical protein O181_033351 [Austropuccinia psidii MF-1]|uniref:Glycoside hydrolase family 5 protein n=1 Tax=Austropuccinia psidii MF-1 TaxID=1389203 RepID=A0A9Q3CYL4_9BASI|nr:hypothetical protein [Austropuccinia psidii MF-1]
MANQSFHHSSNLPRLKTSGHHFIDSRTNQIVLLRGISLSGYSKIPSKPDGRTHLSQSFYDHRNPSFIGHPLQIDHAPHYLSQIVNWGFNFVRLVICWEALEHAGPGVYDRQYIDYIVKLVQLCQQHQLLVLIDAHQDVWSRFSGGSGAPGWTLGLAGFEIENLVETGAAVLHQFGAPRGVWACNHQKLATATMFTLFFAGHFFAPNRKLKRNQHKLWARENGDELITLQEFLQGSMIEAFGQLADALAQFDCVIGFEPMNEPHRGYINLHSPYEWNFQTDLRLYDCPSFIESMALGDGHSQRIDVYTPFWPIPSFRSHTRRLSPSVRAWKPSVNCIWKEHGVWDWDEKRQQPIMLKPHYFNLDPNTGQPFDFYNQALFPFIGRFAKRVQCQRSDWFIPVGPIPNEFYPTWHIDKRPQNLIGAPHFYDLFMIAHKAYGMLTVDVQAIVMKKLFWKCLYFGHTAAKKNYTQQVKNIVNAVHENLLTTPCLIGEAGICMDVNKGEAFKTGNFYWQHQQMDALITALESNLVSFALWHFNPYNTDKHGDGWNWENFSFISQSAMKDSDLYSQPRILSIIKRPYARKVSGIPTRLSYDPETTTFEFEYANPSSFEETGLMEQNFTTNETELFIPLERFPIGKTKVIISDGTYHYDHWNQSLVWKHANLEPGAKHMIKIQSSVRMPTKRPVEHRYKLLLLSLLLGLIGIWIRKPKN